jgi:ribosomal protein L11 methyltransferase
MTDYWKYSIEAAPDTSEVLLAYLSDAPFDTFEEHADGLHAYLPAQEDTAAAETLLNELQQQFDFSWKKELLPGQNWNEIWESNFQPVIVGDFCAVRAEFHAPIPNVRYELLIQPKMAFGTGHHETTWMCLAAMEHLPLQGAHVFDYGCGTGILAIMASKLGAASAEAIDIEDESYRNTLENCAANDVHNVTARCGTLESVQGRDFDGILANINRNVILDSLPRLAELARPGAWMLVSGILEQDGHGVIQQAEACGFRHDKTAQKGAWLSILFWRN